MQLNSAVQDHRLNKRIEYFNQQSSWINILTKTPFEVLHNPLEFIAQLSHFRGPGNEVCTCVEGMHFNLPP